MNILTDQTLSIQLLVYAFVLLFFWGLELLLHSQKFKSKFLHTTLNSKFLFFVFPIQILLSLVVFIVANWTEATQFGFLYLLPSNLSPLFIFIIVFIILDFFDYMYHLMMHKTPLFWQFHQVHHSDLDVDITTTIREHPGETFIRVTYSIIVIFIVGAAPWIIILKQFIQSSSNLISHTKMKLPTKVNSIVSLFFVTPNTHHIHHHFELPHTDSNYGDVLTIWDHLFSTFSKLENSKIIYGIDTNMDKLENKDFKNLIQRPFKNTVNSKNKVIKLNSDTKNY